MQAVSGRQHTFRVVPGDALLHPVALAAIALLILNDHVLKDAFPGFATGKLSDFAGLAFFPLMLLSGWELGVSGIRDRPTFAGHRLIATTAIATCAAFGAMKLLPVANSFAASVLGRAQAIAALDPHPVSVSIALDPTDLIALPAVLVACWIASSRARRAFANG